MNLKSNKINTKRLKGSKSLLFNKDRLRLTSIKSLEWRPKRLLKS